MSDTENYCCPMRRHFVIGVVGTRAGEPVPTEVGEYVLDFERAPRVLVLRFCPFCGLRIAGDQTLRLMRPCDS